MSNLFLIFFLTGDTVSIVANIQNSSSKTMRPKFSLQQKTVYRASGSTNTDDKNLCKGLGNTINPNSSESVSCQMMIPSDALYTLCNCDIVSVEYYIKVWNTTMLTLHQIRNTGFIACFLLWDCIVRELLWPAHLYIIKNINIH